jgi:hypothetical protein
MRAVGLIMIFLSIVAIATSLATVVGDYEDKRWRTAIGIAGLIGGVVIVVVKSQRKDFVGFEVKPITGETPVLREKENDHG